MKIENLEDLMRLADSDPRHYTGEIVGSMTTSVHPKVFDVVAKYIEKNQNDHVLFPSLSVVERELLSTTKEMLGLAEEVGGAVTSGGTESNILALYAWKRRYNVRAVIHMESAHQSIVKAAALLGLRTVKVSVDRDGYYNREELERAIARNPNSILVITMGTTEIGRVDPIAPLLDLVEKYNVHVHIDGALGGFTYPFTNKEDFKEYAELVNRGVATLSADYHKFPGAPVPSSALFFERRLEEAIVWESQYMPAGTQKGLLGTRPGYSAAGALATLIVKGKSGLERDAKESLSTALWTRDKLTDLGRFYIPKPDVPLICIGFESSGAIREAWKYLWESGIKTYFCSKPQGLRVVFMPHVRRKHAERLVEKLEEFFRKSS